VDNLFNPFVPLKDATDWLLQLSEASFQYIARALKDLLSLEDQDRLVRNEGPPPRVEVQTMGTAVPLEQLSDGYQSVLALATDVMAVMLDRWKSMDVAEGIVLLDEIGAHLHPRWKMRIVRSLRQVFPRVQFVVSTHNPLCLRGLLEGEVVVMRRGADDQVVALTDLPPVEGLRVDQLLTSEHFGLDSTVDPEIDEMFEEYYRLLAARERSQAEEERLEQLKVRLKKLDLLGTTRRERLALEAVDEYLAEEPKLIDPDSRRALKDQTRSKVAQIWSRLEREENA
jgi:predicted ATP-binding protein involved in virulence